MRARSRTWRMIKDMAAAAFIIGQIYLLWGLAAALG